MERLRFGIIGYPDSGKSIVANRLEERHGFKIISAGEIIQSEAGEEKLESNKDFFDFQYKLRGSLGMKKLKFIGEFALNLVNDRVAVVGLRNRYDAMAVNQAGGTLIALSKLSENGSSPKPDHLDWFGDHTNWLIQHADYSIDSGRKRKIHKQLDKIVALELKNQEQS